MEIDGAYGEGGGQILRTAVALSCITGIEIEVKNIRRGRRIPGLRPQHLSGIKLAANMCNADVEGLEIGSSTIKFSPGEIKSGKYKMDIGTAGSLTLLLQTIIPITIASEKEFAFELTGGTDVRFSPLADYYAHVLFRLLNRYGTNLDMNILQRGYYPEGGGKIIVNVKKGNLGNISIKERGDEGVKEFWFNSRNLPEHIAHRMRKILWNFGEFHMDFGMNAKSTGCGVLLMQNFENTIIGADELCQKGVPAEKVAKKALEKFNYEVNSAGTVDSHISDHLPIFSFLAGKVEFIPSQITKHTSTNLWLVQKFGARVEKGKTIKIET